MTAVWVPCNGCSWFGIDDDACTAERHVQIDMDEIVRAAEHQEQLHGWERPFYFRLSVPHEGKGHSHVVQTYIAGDADTDWIDEFASPPSSAYIRHDTGERP